MRDDTIRGEASEEELGTPPFGAPVSLNAFFCLMDLEVDSFSFGESTFAVLRRISCREDLLLSSNIHVSRPELLPSCVTEDCLSPRFLSFSATSVENLENPVLHGNSQKCVLQSL